LIAICTFQFSNKQLHGQLVGNVIKVGNMSATCYGFVTDNLLKPIVGWQWQPVYRRPIETCRKPLSIASRHDQIFRLVANASRHIDTESRVENESVRLTGV